VERGAERVGRGFDDGGERGEGEIGGWWRGVVLAGAAGAGMLLRRGGECNGGGFEGGDV